MADAGYSSGTFMEEQIRALETRRRAGEKVPELDVLYSKMDADTNKGHDAATKKQPPAQPPKPSMFKRIFGIPTGQERTDKLKQDIEKMKKGGMPMKNGKPAFIKKYGKGGIAKKLLSKIEDQKWVDALGGKLSNPGSPSPAEREATVIRDVFLREKAKEPKYEPSQAWFDKMMAEADRQGLLTKKTGGSIKSYAKGGSVSSRGDGVAQRGKTKGRFV